MGLGIQEILLIMVLVLIFFGVDKIPQLARSLGKGMSEFRRAQQDFKEELAIAAGTEPTEAKRTTVSTEAGLAPTEPRCGHEPGGSPLDVCPYCQGQIARGSLYCSQCGRRMTTEVTCDLCHRQLQSQEKFCPNCGQARPE